MDNIQTLDTKLFSVFYLLTPPYVQVAEFKCLLGVKANTKEWILWQNSPASKRIWCYNRLVTVHQCWKDPRSHSSSVYLEIKLTEEVARDKQSCFFFRKQVRLQETLTPKKSLILALQEAERNGNSIYIICLIRVEDSEDEDHTSQVAKHWCSLQVSTESLWFTPKERY